MAIENISTFTNPYDPTEPFSNAYAYAAGLGIDLSLGKGRITYNVHPSENKWHGVPLGQISINLGDILIPGNIDEDIDDVKMPTLQELMAIPEFVQAFGTIAYIIDGFSINHPLFEGGNVKAPGE